MAVVGKPVDPHIRTMGGGGEGGGGGPFAGGLLRCRVGGKFRWCVLFPLPVLFFW